MLDAEVIAALNDYHSARGHPSLLELEAMLVPLGADANVIARSYMGTPWMQRLGAGWEADAVWPFFARHMDILGEWLRLESGDYWFNGSAAFDAIAAFPEPPAEFVPRLLEVALGTAKTYRRAAQDALDRLPGREDRLIGALAERKAETRAIAAEWLGRLGYAKAIPALEAALRKESSDACIGALMSALEALGVSLDPFLNRDGLPGEALKGLAKGIPASIAWFPWDALPEVRWAEGKAVPREVLQWFVVQAAKLKSPEPHALLRRYAALFVPADRERFGQLVLEAWIAEDVRPIEREEAEKRARDQARQMHAWMKSYPQYANENPLHGKSEEDLFAHFLPGHLRQPKGSAIDAKGVLAVAAACCGRDAASTAARYLKEYYGTRAAQGKALIAMLAWTEHASATQLMLSVGNRFRTKSFQDEAMRQAEALAERKGWTVNDLSDRTIPSAGFDESGAMELRFGERVFHREARRAVQGRALQRRGQEDRRAPRAAQGRGRGAGRGRRRKPSGRRRRK
jgi:hypothetical protein